MKASRIEWVFCRFVCISKKGQRNVMLGISSPVCKWERKERIVNLCDAWNCDLEMKIFVCYWLYLLFVSKQMAKSRSRTRARHLWQDWAYPPSPWLDPCSLCHPCSQALCSSQVCQQVALPRPPSMYYHPQVTHIRVGVQWLGFFLEFDCCVLNGADL